MTYENENAVYVRQNINGNNLQVAGRDIINNGNFIPNLSGPEIVNCRTCQTPISRKAVECGACYHNFHHEMILEKQKAKKEAEDLKYTMLVVIVVTLVLTLNVNSKSNLNMGESFVTVVISMFFSWYLGIVALVHIKAWWKERS